METLLRCGLANAGLATMLAIPAALLGRWSRRPALAHAAWLLVLLKLVTPPLFSLPFERPEPAEPASLPPAAAVVAEPMIEVEPEEATALEGPVVIEPEPVPRPAASVPGPRWTWTQVWPWIAGGWGAGAMVSLVVVSRRVNRFRRLLRYAEPAAEAEQSRCDELAELVGLRRGPEVWRVPGPVCPMIWFTVGRPRLLLPAKLWGSLGDDRRDTLLLHELAHLRRGDHLVRWLECVAGALYWWHPVAWWARRGLREAEEQCCDAWVVSTWPGAGKTYAGALLDSVDFLSATAPPPAFASGMGQVHHLKRRLLMIKRGETPRSLGRAGTLAFWMLGCLSLPFGPAWAQTSPDAAPPPAAPLVPAPPPTPAAPAAPGEAAPAALAPSAPVPVAASAPAAPAAPAVAPVPLPTPTPALADADDEAEVVLDDEEGADAGLHRAERRVRELETQLRKARAELEARKGAVVARRKARDAAERATARTEPRGRRDSDGPPRPPALPRIPRAARPPRPQGLPGSTPSPDLAPDLPPSVPSPPADRDGQERRLRDLERKFDRILDELEKMKDHRRGADEAPRAEAPRADVRTFTFPIGAYF